MIDFLKIVLGVVLIGIAIAFPELAPIILSGLKVAGVALITAGLAEQPKPIDRSGIGKDRTSVYRASLAAARWIIGRQRVGGQLIYVSQREDVLLVAIAIAEGPCDSIEEIYINGVAQNITRTTKGNAVLCRPSGTDYAGHMVCWEYFAADGTQGNELRGFSGQSLPTVALADNVAATADWTSDHQGKNISWVMVAFKQNADRLYVNIPEIQFLVKGLKFETPYTDLNGLGPTWSENTADVLYWWLRERRGFLADDIDETEYFAAREVCGEEVTITVPESHNVYENVFFRYSVNMVIDSDDVAQSVQDLIVFTMAGEIIEKGGRWSIRPGITRDVSYYITRDDLTTKPVLAPQPNINERINAATIGVKQSAEDEYREIALPKFVDTFQQAADGIEIHKEFGSLATITRPLQAGMLLAINIRRARTLRSLTISISPGDNFEHWGISPTDILEFRYPFDASDVSKWEVVSVQLGSDLAVTLSLRQAFDDTYDTTLVLPPLPLPKLTAPVLNTVSDLTVDEVARGQHDGSVNVLIIITWTASAAQSSEVGWRHEDDTPEIWASASVDGTRHEISGAEVGVDYLIRVRLKRRDGTFSPWVYSAINPSGDLTPPARPTNFAFTKLDGSFEITYDLPADDDFAYVEVTVAHNLQYSPANGFIVSQTRDAQWSPNYKLDSDANYNLWLRSFDTSGNASAYSSRHLVTTGAIIFRNSKGVFFYRESGLNVWSDSKANSALPPPLTTRFIGDIVTLSSTDSQYSETRSWSGTAWISIGTLFNGNLLVEGTITADHLAVNSVLSKHISAGTIRATNIETDTLTVANTNIEAFAIRNVYEQVGDDYALYIKSLSVTSITTPDDWSDYQFLCLLLRGGWRGAYFTSTTAQVSRIVPIKHIPLYTSYSITNGVITTTGGEQTFNPMIVMGVIWLDVDDSGGFHIQVFRTGNQLHFKLRRTSGELSILTDRTYLMGAYLMKAPKG